MRTKKKAPSAHPNQGRRWGLKRVSNVDAIFDSFSQGG